MKSFIEELYYGNIDPQNSGFITGFRLGARFVLDSFILPEASLQNYGRIRLVSVSATPFTYRAWLLVMTFAASPLNSVT